MKLRFIITFSCLLAFGANAQIDSKKKSGSIIPAIESPKDSADSKKNIPEKPKQNNQLGNMSQPQNLGKLELPKKEFSMFPQEEFANPGELYTKKLDKIEKTLLPEGYGENSGLKEDAFWGDYRTTSKTLTLLFRDYSAIDGDLLRVYVNGDILRSNIYLGGGFQSLKIDLKDGLNEIIFQAVNTGASGPNTAEYKIVDETNNVISSRVWALEAGIKVTAVILKE